MLVQLGRMARAMSSCLLDVVRSLVSSRIWSGY